MTAILTADDHALLRAGLKTFLADYPDIVVAGEAASGVEALAALRSGSYDAIVLDMTMPGRSGVELIRQIKAEHPKLPVLVLSMHQEDVYAVRALRAGASGYLCKDNAESQLVAAIRKVAGGGLYLTPTVAEKFTQAVLGGAGGQSHTALSDR